MLFPNNASTVLFSSILENGSCNNIVLTRQVSVPVRERLTWKVVWYFQVFFRLSFSKNWYKIREQHVRKIGCILSKVACAKRR